MTENNKVSKDALFQAIVTEAGGLYKVVAVTASSFLGGSLLFIEKIAPNPVACTLWLLGLGWVLLIVSISLVAWVRLLNLDSGRLALEEKYKEASRIDKNKEKYTITAIILLAVGMALIMAFGLINIHQSKGVVQMGVKKTKKITKQVVKSIPFGSTGGGSSSNKEDANTQTGGQSDEEKTSETKK